jgi:hypothetical protein
MIKDDASYIQSALHNYQNVQCVSLDEFNDDLNRIITIKKAITRYKNGDEINVRLVLNQFIILFNVFGDVAFEMLKYKLDKSHYNVAFCFLVAINRLPESEMILLDQIVVDKLRKELNG